MGIQSRNIASALWRWLCAPLGRNAYFFASLLAIKLTWVAARYLFAVDSMKLFAVAIAYCYAVALPLGLIPRGHWLRKVYVPLAYIVVAVPTIIAIYFVVALDGMAVSGNELGAIFNTNYAEARGMLATYTSWPFVILVTIGAAVAIAAYHLLKRRPVRHGALTSLGAALCLADCAVAYATTPAYGDWTGGEVAFVEFVNDYEPRPDLRATQTLYTPTLALGNTRVPLVVLIIGESHNSAFSSLYGYQRDTNPRLHALAADSSLVVFSHATSPACHTQPAFKWMMTDGRADTIGETLADWQRRAFLPTTMHQGGYRTYWVSNQGEYGLYDNISAQVGALSDSTVFVKPLVANSYDIAVVAPLRQIIAERGAQPTFVAVHLLGGHQHFADRYPPQFARFTVDDYAAYPEPQRIHRAEYDNALLYNDYVLAEIFASLRGRDAVALYVPDHGLDIYQSSDHYFAHAKSGDAASVHAASQIPVVAYATAEFRAAHPAQWQWLRQTAAQPIVTAHLQNLLLPAIGMQ